MNDIINFLTGNWGWLLLGELISFLLFCFLWNLIIVAAAGSLVGRRKSGFLGSTIDTFVVFLMGACGISAVLCQIGWVVGLTIWLC